VLVDMTSYFTQKNKVAALNTGAAIAKVEGNMANAAKQNVNAAAVKAAKAK
jgi:hypothetical protein